MRVTVGMISNQYSKSLNDALGRLNYYNNRATNFRKFDKFSEDPVAATQSFCLHREYQQNSDYQSNLRDTENLFLSAQSSMMSINTMVQETVSGDCLQAITATSGPDERAIIAEKLRRVQESIISTANAKFADRYMFGASCTTVPPFSVGKSGNLLYRGADVTTGKLEDGAATNVGDFKINFGAENGDKLNGYVMEIVRNPAGPPNLNEAVIDSANRKITVNLPEGATGQQLQDLLQNPSATTGPGGTAVTDIDLSKIIVKGDLGAQVSLGTSQPINDKVNLRELAEEKIFTDLGLGLQFGADGKIKEQSAFDIAMPGISFLGYGQTADGIPNNIYDLIGNIAKQLNSPDFSVEKFQPYLKHLENQQMNILKTITASGVKSKYIENTKHRLLDGEFNINVKLIDIEELDPAKAIIDFKMQEYSYRAALQMGTKILQPTFLDFMR